MNQVTVEPTLEVVKTNGHGTAVPKVEARGPAPKKRNWIAIGGAIAAAAVIALSPVIYSAYTHESTDNAFIDGHVVALSAKVANPITKVYVEDNQMVNAGDPLVEIDPRDYEAALTEARGKLGAEEATARKTRADLARAERLLRVDAISRQQLDSARADADNAVAKVQEEQGLVQKAELNLAYTKVVAPIAGRVTRKSAEVGNYVQVGEALMAIVPTQVWVTANFKETQLTRMAPGQPVTVKVDAFPNQTLHGHVDSIQSGTGARFSLIPPENATGNYVKVVQRVPVKIQLDAAGDQLHLAPGMSVVPSVKVR
jgi:membrane fusion protein (multidrug efflux system)